jgi:hypothetical protein
MKLYSNGLNIWYLKMKENLSKRLPLALLNMGPCSFAQLFVPKFALLVLILMLEII